MSYVIPRCGPRGRHRERLQGPRPRGHRKHQEGDVSSAPPHWLTTATTGTNSPCPYELHNADQTLFRSLSLFLSLSLSQDRGAADHPV